ncbi:2-hydroxyacid dehydrogenase [uncultured Ruthenibacterium sp.]|uniref:2-hydroxyacid dehydrogenase n=1 Tax=uncultured Ruthenibacterium sp. TaxID=1905347 RepID=UPI00349E8C8A
MKIVLLESLGISEESLQRRIAPLVRAGHVFEVYSRTTDPERLVQECDGAQAVLLANMPFPDGVIDRCQDLRFIDIAFTGVDHVGLDAARKKGITVSNASGYSTTAVAELTVCMMLSLLRNVSAVQTRCRTGQTKDGLVGSELAGKTVGIVGTGAIGLRVAELCHAFGCEIIAFSRTQRPEAPDYVRYVPLDALMALSDVVTLHCPLTEQTRGLINEQRLSLMKPGALLINAARGGVVDTQALADALISGRLGGAGVDVFDVEPPLPEDHPLLHTPNTLVTPHVAFATVQSMELRADIVFDNLMQWMNGHPVRQIL